MNAESTSNTANYGHLVPENVEIDEFCSAFKMSRRTYYRMRAAGDGPATTWISGRPIILKRSVDEWVRARTEMRGRPYRLAS